MLHKFALGETENVITPSLFNHLENQHQHEQHQDQDQDYFKLARKALFDSVCECLTLRCKHHVILGCKASPKSSALFLKKSLLAEELYREIVSWKNMGDFLVDEVVDKDMSSGYGKWVEFDVEAFEEGVEIESSILTCLIDELVSDLFWWFEEHCVSSSSYNRIHVFTFETIAIVTYLLYVYVHTLITSVNTNHMRLNASLGVAAFVFYMFRNQDYLSEMTFRVSLELFLLSTSEYKWRKPEAIFWKFIWKSFWKSRNTSVNYSNTIWNNFQSQLFKYHLNLKQFSKTEAKRQSIQWTFNFLKMTFISLL